MTSVNIKKILELFQHYLKEVAKCQQASKYNTNNILASLVNQLQDLYSLILSGAVHTGVEVHRMDLEMSGLVERPWLQLMYCAVCLLHGRNFR